MKSVLTQVIAIIGVSLVSCDASAQQIVYLVRHAEKATSGRTDAEIPLTQFGRDQAERLADRLEDKGIGAVYYSRFDPLLEKKGTGGSILRTKETAAPLVRRLTEQKKSVAEHDLIYPISIINWRSECGVMERFAAEAVRKIRQIQRDRPTETILIVGHENTVPAIIREFAALQHISLPPETDLRWPLEFMGAKEFGLLYRLDLGEKTPEKFLRVERYASSSSTSTPSRVIYPPEPAKTK